jgi:thiamine transport system ATP-binding protein
MRALEVVRLSAGYADGPDVLDAVDVDVAPGEVVALLGASGSGKSTLLRCIAGLHRPRAGAIAIAGQDMDGVRVERRGIGLVFQDHALFPHQDVAANVAFGPRMQGLGRAECEARAMQALSDVGLAHLARRAVDELSGGEQQRVALARALASRPRLLLLDEPYGSLDRPLRERLVAELPGLVRSQGIGALLVTHDQQEALRAADRIAVMVAGRVRQLDTPARVWADPADTEVAAFLGVGPLLSAEVRDGVARGPFGALPLPQAPDGPATVLVPLRALRIATGAAVDSAVTVALDATLIESRFAGEHHRVEIRLADGTRTTVRAETADGLPSPGGAMALYVDTDALRAFPGAARQ